MKPIRFKGSNALYAKDQVQYISLPSHETQDGEIISCWRFSFWDRARVLFGAKLWHHTLTFKHPLQPQKVSLDYPEAVKSYLDNHDSADVPIPQEEL